MAVSEERIGNVLRSGDHRKRAAGIVGGVSLLARLSAAALLAVSLMLLLAPTAEVTAQSSSSSSTMQLNNAPFTLFGFNSGSTETALGDVNGDGKPDVVVLGEQFNPSTSVTTNTVETFFGNASGTFPQTPSQATTLSTSGILGPIALADTTGDGHLDLVTTDSNCEVDIFLGNGNGTFQTSPVTFSLLNYCGSTTSQIYVADFNGNGKPDIIVPTSFSNTADVLINTTPTGALQPTFTDSSITLTSSFSQSVSALAVEDFNGDGFPDLAVGLTKFGSPVTNSVEIILNSQNTTNPFPATPTPSVNFPLPSDANTSGLSSLAVGDFNGDGKLDVAAMQPGQHGDNAIFVLYGDGNGGLTSCSPTTLQPCSSAPGQTITGLPMGTIGQPQLVAGDFNRDGKADLAFTNGNDGFSVLLSSGASGFLQPAGNYVAGSPTGSAGMTLLAGDLNGDGFPDLVMAAGNGFSAFLNAGTANPGIFEGTQAFAAGPSPQNIVSFTNFFGVGEADVAVLNPPVSGVSNATVSVMQTTSSTSGALGGLKTFDISNGDATAQPVALAAGCLTANANPCPNPFLVAATFDSTNTLTGLWEVQGGTGTPSVQRLPLANSVPPDEEVLAIVTGDFNGDGNTDLALSLRYELLVVTGNGNGTFNFDSTATPLPLASPATQLLVANFQGTGTLPDLAVLQSASVGVFLNNTTSTSSVSFQSEATYTVPTGPSSMAEGDFNADGFPDLAVVAGQAVTVLLNNGNGAFQQTASSPISVDNATGQIAAGNFGNGNVDLAITSGTFGASGCNVADTLIVLVGDGTGNFATPTTCGAFATGLTFAAGNTPNSVALGDFNGDGKLDAAVADAGGFGSPTGMVTVLLNGPASSVGGAPPLSINPTTISGDTAGAPYSSVTFEATGGTPPFTFTETGLLPTGMTFSSSLDTLSGTPTQIGSFSIKVTAADSTGATATQNYSFVIGCPTITVTPSGTLSSATDGLSYSPVQFAESGGVGTTTFTQSGAPAGISISSGGLLSGTPTQAGNFSVAVTATDSNGCTGSATLSLTVAAPAPPPPAQVTDNETITVTDTPVFPVADNEPITVNDQVSVAPTGTTAQQPFAFFTETSLNFGNVAAGQTATEELLLQNTGQTPLVIQQAVATPSSQFTLSAIACNNPPSATFPVSVAAGGLCTVTVTFQQSATPGTPTGALTFTDNAVNNSNLPSVPSGSLAMQTVPLLTSGTATAPPSTVVLPPDNEMITVTDTATVTAFTPSYSVLAVPAGPITTDSNGNYILQLTIKNQSNVTVLGVSLTSALLNSTSANSLPSSITSLIPGASVIVTLTFSSSAGAAGNHGVLHIQGTYAGSLPGGATQPEGFSSGSRVIL